MAGVTRSNWYPEQALSQIEDARKRALYETGSFLLAESNKTVPYEMGILQNSGHVDVAADGSRAVVAYDTPYAVRLHENPQYNFAHGRRGKWLEQTFKEQLHQARDLMVRLMKSRWPG